MKDLNYPKPTLPRQQTQRHRVIVRLVRTFHQCLGQPGNDKSSDLIDELVLSAKERSGTVEAWFRWHEANIRADNTGNRDDVRESMRWCRYVDWISQEESGLKPKPFEEPTWMS